MDLGAKRREIKNHEELVHFLNQLLLTRANLTIGKVILDIRCYQEINLGATGERKINLGAKKQEIKNHEEIVHSLDQLLLTRANLTIGNI